MFKRIALVVAALIVAVLVIAAFQPDSFRIERSATIKAPPEKVYALIDDFRKWPLWSPWEKMDPAMQRTYSGPAQGKGAAYAWKGNDTVGAGRMEIRESQPPSRILIQLDFLAPFEAHNTAEFTLQPLGDSTEVKWAMYGPSPYISKLFCLFMDMDEMVGKDFEAGLANMKAAAER